MPKAKDDLKHIFWDMFLGILISRVVKKGITPGKLKNYYREYCGERER